MKIFISWSGERSRQMAIALKEWLPSVFQGTDVFMSESDIEAGARWGNKLNSELELSSFGIVCLTPENQISPWLVFEAGALSKAVQESHVVPFLLNVKFTNVEGPLSQFQAATADKEGTYKLMKSINLKHSPTLSTEQLKRTFEVWFPSLLKKLDEISPPQETILERSHTSLLEEILQLVRSQTKNSKPSSEFPSMHSATVDQVQGLTNDELKTFLNMCRLRDEDAGMSESDALYSTIQKVETEMAKRGIKNKT